MRCANGTRKNKLSGKCEPFNKTRCTKGSRKNKLSGKCKKDKTGSKKSKKSMKNIEKKSGLKRGSLSEKQDGKYIKYLDSNHNFDFDYKNITLVDAIDAKLLEIYPDSSKIQWRIELESDDVVVLDWSGSIKLYPKPIYFNINNKEYMVNWVK